MSTHADRHLSQITGLREQRAALLNQQHRILDKADAEQRALTQDEGADFDNQARTIDKLDQEIARLERTAPIKPTGIQPEAVNPHSTTGESRGNWLHATLEHRDLLTTGGGGYIVPPQHAGQVWDRLAATSVGLAAGFTIIGTDRDELHIPRVTSDVAANWTAEGAPITDTDIGLNETIATPRKLAALEAISNEMVADANPAVLDVVSNNMLRAMALKLDLGFFEGTGTPPQIKGLRNVSSIQTVSLGTNGAIPTNLDPIADAIGLLEQANANATAIVMHPRTWQTLSKLKEQTTGNNKPLLQDSAGSGSQGIRRAIYGVPVFLSSQLSVTETQGDATTASSIYVIDAAQVLAIRRQDVTVQIDTSRLFNQDMTEIRAISRWDIAVPNPTAVCRVLGVLV